MMRSILLAAWVCALPGAVAFSQGRPQPRLVMDALDVNHDGTLSAAEIGVAPASLLKLDRNGDGQLTTDELSPRPENAGAAPDELAKQLMGFDKDSKGYLIPSDLPERMQGLFKRADADHDGKLTLDEIKALSGRQGMPAGAAATPGRAAGMFRMDPLLNALDKDHDGVISAEEIAGAPASLATLDKNGDGELTADEIRVRQQTPEERADHMLGEWDTDKDGKVSKAEAPERMVAQFDSYDKNGDGFLERDELIEMFKAQGSQGRPNAAPGGTPVAAPAH